MAADDGGGRPKLVTCGESGGGGADDGDTGDLRVCSIDCTGAVRVVSVGCAEDVDAEGGRLRTGDVSGRFCEVRVGKLTVLNSSTVGQSTTCSSGDLLAARV